MMIPQTVSTQQRMELVNRLSLVKTNADCKLQESESRSSQQKRKILGGDALTCYQVWKLMEIPVCAETEDDRAAALTNLEKTKDDSAPGGFRWKYILA